MAKDAKNAKNDDGADSDGKEFKYNVIINGEMYLWARPQITGKDIKELVKVEIDKYEVFRLIGREEKLINDVDKIDLTKPGEYIFITKEKDVEPNIYKFILNDEDYTWDSSVISGLELKKQAKVNPQEYDLWRDVSGEEDKLINNEDKVSLGDKGVDYIFFTIKKQSTEGD